MTRKTQKKLRKILTLVSCAVLLVCVTVVGTIAYLQDQTETVTNTFTVGNVGFEEPTEENKLAGGLDEAKVDENGELIPDASRVLQNEYKLVPGHTYTKDPTVHIAANSEDSFVFVKVTSGIDEIEAATDDDYNTIAEQIIEEGWTALEGVEGVYYKKHTKATDRMDYVVFNEFKIDNDVNNSTLEGYVNKTITITAYIIQNDGFADAKAAWDAGKFN